MRAVFKQMCLVLFNRSPVLNLEDGNTLKHQSYDSDTSTTVVSTLDESTHPYCSLGCPDRMTVLDDDLEEKFLFLKCKIYPEALLH